MIIHQKKNNIQKIILEKFVINEKKFKNYVLEIIYIFFFQSFFF